MKQRVLIWMFVVWSLGAGSRAQTTALGFYPCHPGDRWQWRSVFTGMVANTKVTDSVEADSISHSRVIYGRYINVSGSSYKERIDSLGNVYNLSFQPSHIRYKLYADSGTTWQAGLESDSTPVAATVAFVYQTKVFGVSANVKAIRFQIAYPPPHQITLGTDHLADGFGSVESEIEPSDVWYLSGAKIGGIQYGIIADIRDGTRVGLQRPTLRQNYPNPFNSSTTIRYALPARSHLTLSVFNTLGQQVAVLVNGEVDPGTHEVKFDGSNIASGIYFYRIQAGSFIQANKLVLLH